MAIRRLVVALAFIASAVPGDDAAASGREPCITAVGLVATNEGGEPPALYSIPLGYWDVDGGGSYGTEGERGTYNMGLSVERGHVGCIEDVRLIASESDSPPPSPGEDWVLVGNWDVDGDGGVGVDNRSEGAFMMGLYVKPAVAGAGGGRVLTDLLLAASNSSQPFPTLRGYERVGYWDVDGGGSRAADGSTGHHMMTMQRRREERPIQLGVPVGRWIVAGSGGQNLTVGLEKALWTGNITESQFTKEVRESLSATIGSQIEFGGSVLSSSVSSSLETATSEARRIVSEKRVGYTERCQQTVDQIQFNISTVWQWEVVTRVGNEPVSVRTCQITCTADATAPAYLPGDSASFLACLTPRQRSGTASGGDRHQAFQPAGAFRTSSSTSPSASSP